MKKDKEILEFKCVVKRQRFNSENYKIYLVDVDDKVYPNIKTNKNNEVILVGDMSNLILSLEYKIKATVGIHKTFGIQYNVISATQDKPTTLESSQTFLYGIGVNEKNADNLLKTYPNIIDKIIKNDLDDVDLNKVKGIKDKTFNKIKLKVIENFSLIEVVDFFKGLISLNVIKKLYDKYKSINVIKKQMTKNPYKCLCNISRIGFKTADDILLELDIKSKNKDTEFNFTEDLLTSKQRMKACIDFILGENENNGHTKISIKELRTQCNKLTPECIGHFVSIIKDNDESIFVHNETSYISSIKAYNTEKYIADTLKSMLINSFQWNVNSELYREDDGFKLTDEQLQTLDYVCKYNVVMLTAPAGAGKTSSVKNLLTMLDDNNKTYMLCSPTGKASEVLSEQTGREAGTIHRQLKFNPSLENPWTYNENNKLPYDVVIIDEFSMVDIFLFKHLLEAININNTKLLLVCDNYQLASVGCGNIAQDILSSNIVPIVRLTQIFRYAEGGLMQVVTKIRNGENFIDKINHVKIFGTKKDFIFLETQQTRIINETLKIYQKILNDGYNIEDIMVLVSQNKGDYGTKVINKRIQWFMQKNKNNKFIMSGDRKFYKDDKVIQIMNNYNAKTPDFLHNNKIMNKDKTEDEEVSVFNGNTGIVCDVGFNNIVVDFGKGKYILYEKEDLNQIELGYSISTHKAQGDSAKQIICLTPKAHTFMLNSNLLYVAGTRAKERVYMLGNLITVNKAIKKKENLQRNTWLVELLQTA